MASVDEVRSFVYGLIDIFPGVLRTPARWVADRVFGIWNEIYEHLTTLVDPFKYLRERFHILMLTIVEHANQISATLRWFATLFVPRWARWALDTASLVLRREFTSLWRQLGDIVNKLGAWAQRAINVVDAYAHNALRWATDHVQEIWSTLTRVRDLVFKMLTSPEFLVDWLFSALWRRFWKYLNDHAEPIIAAWWAGHHNLILKALARAESFLARIL